MRRRTLALTAGAVALVACRTGHPPVDASRMLAAATTDPALEDTTWTLVQVAGAPAVTTPGDGDAQLVLDAIAKRLAGSTGCNRFSARYELDGAVLRVGPLATTRMACAPPLAAQETRLLEALERTASYRVAGEALELRAGDEVLARFVARGGAAP